MNHAPASKTPLKPWLAADLADSQQWIVAADPELAVLSSEALQAWFAPAREQLLYGYGVVLIRGLSPQPESTFRRLYLALGRCLGTPDATYGELYDVTEDLAEARDVAAAHPDEVAQAERWFRAAHTPSPRWRHPGWGAGKSGAQKKGNGKKATGR